MPRNGWTLKSALCCLFLGILLPAGLSAQRIKGLEDELSRIYEAGKMYAVTISVSAIPTARSGYFPPSRDGGYEMAIGSGFIYDSLGHIVTSSSVAEQGNFFRITFVDGTTRFGELVGIDLEDNIAVLEVNHPPFPAPVMANSDNLTPGRWIGIIGNSFGIFPSFAYGSVAGKDENGSLLLTADLSPGCAGGLVIDAEGRAAGMIAYKLTESISLGSLRMNIPDQKSLKSLVLTDAEVEIPVGGYSLAIPSNKIKRAARGIISGEINHGAFLGIIPEDLDVDWAKRVFNINYGVYITSVQEDSPAYTAGIREGDILLNFGWQKITSSEQLRKLILNSKPGSRVDLKILRTGKIRTVTAEMGYASQSGSNSTPGREAVSQNRNTSKSTNHRK